MASLGKSASLGKFQTVRWDRIIVRNEDNVRLSVGRSVFGHTVSVDKWDIDTMVSSLLATAKMETPVQVSKQQDGTLKLLCGYRRMNAVIRIQTDPQYSELQRTPFIEIPCIVHESLSVLEEKRIANDQTSLDFLASEVFLSIVEELRSGVSWMKLALVYFPQIGRMLGSTGMKKVNEVRSASDADRQKILKNWLNGTVGQHWTALASFPDWILGDYVLGLMYQDGLTTDRPKYKLDRESCKKVVKSLEQDKANKVDPQSDGSATMSILLAEEKSKPSSRKLKRASEIEEFQKMNCNVGVVAQLLEVVWADGYAPDQLRLVNNLQGIRDLELDLKNPQLADLFKCIQDCDYDRIEAILIELDR